MKPGWSQGPAPEARNFINFRFPGPDFLILFQKIPPPGGAKRPRGAAGGGAEGYFLKKYLKIRAEGSKIDEIPGLGGRTLGPYMFHNFLSDAASHPGKGYFLKKY